MLGAVSFTTAELVTMALALVLVVLLSIIGFQAWRNRRDHSNNPSHRYLTFGGIPRVYMIALAI